MPILLRPMWLFAIIPLIFVIFWIYYRQTKSHNWSKVCDPELLQDLIISSGNRNIFPLLMLGLAWLLIILALSGPSWTKVESPVFKSTATTIILLDLSSEMLVQDPYPSRLARAKYKISDLLNSTSDRQYGLAVFSGEPFTVSPVTSDGYTIDSLLSALDPSIVPVAGRNISQALEHAKNLLSQSGQLKGSILLITTSDASKDSISKASELKQKGITVSVLGIGTSKGGPIPSVKGFIKDNNNKVILSKIDAYSLKKLANAGGGGYKTLTNDQVDLEELVKSWNIEAKKGEDDLKMVRYRDDGYWLLWLLIPIAVMVFRPGWRDSVV